LAYTKSILEWMECNVYHLEKPVITGDKRQYGRERVIIWSGCCVTSYLSKGDTFSWFCYFVYHSIQLQWL